MAPVLRPRPGVLGTCLRPPATVGLRLVERRILLGIRANAERARG